MFKLRSVRSILLPISVTLGDEGGTSGCAKAVLGSVGRAQVRPPGSAHITCMSASLAVAFGTHDVVAASDVMLALLVMVRGTAEGDEKDLDPVLRCC